MKPSTETTKTPAKITDTYNGIIQAVEKATIPAFPEEQPKARVTFISKIGRFNQPFFF